MSADDYLQKILQEQEAIRRVLDDPYRIKDANAVLRATDPFFYSATAAGPPYSQAIIQQQADEARKLWESQLENQLAIERAINQERELTFRLAQIDEANRLARQAMYEKSEYSKLLESIDLQARMRGMHQPWLGHDIGKSALAFSEIQAIGIGLDIRQPFETEFTSAIRKSLGDWRHSFEPPVASLLDPAFRSDLYIERGFNPALTNFPEPAFVESIGLAGLNVWHETPADVGDEDEQDDAEKRYKRNAAAFDRLQRFETEFREFIEQTMLHVFWREVDQAANEGRDAGGVAGKERKGSQGRTA
jgi:hypothetical protein